MKKSICIIVLGGLLFFSSCKTISPQTAYPAKDTATSGSSTYYSLTILLRGIEGKAINDDMARVREALGHENILSWELNVLPDGTKRIKVYMELVSRRTIQLICSELLSISNSINVWVD